MNFVASFSWSDVIHARKKWELIRIWVNDACYCDQDYESFFFVRKLDFRKIHERCLEFWFEFRWKRWQKHFQRQYSLKKSRQISLLTIFNNLCHWFMKVQREFSRMFTSILSRSITCSKWWRCFLCISNFQTIMIWWFFIVSSDYVIDKVLIYEEVTKMNYIEFIAQKRNSSQISSLTFIVSENFRFSLSENVKTDFSSFTSSFITIFFKNVRISKKMTSNEKFVTTFSDFSDVLIFNIVREISTKKAFSFQVVRQNSFDCEFDLTNLDESIEVSSIKKRKNVSDVKKSTLKKRKMIKNLIEKKIIETSSSLTSTKRSTRRSA